MDASEHVVRVKATAAKEATFCNALLQEQRRQQRKGRPLSPKQQVHVTHWSLPCSPYLCMPPAPRLTERRGGSGACARSLGKAIRVRMLRRLLQTSFQVGRELQGGEARTRSRFRNGKFTYNEIIFFVMKSEREPFACSRALHCIIFVTPVAAPCRRFPPRRTRRRP